jgi:hypothetical protein
MGDSHVNYVTGNIPEYEKCEPPYYNPINAETLLLTFLRSDCKFCAFKSAHFLRTFHCKAQDFAHLNQLIFAHISL